mmetsp:Transcript_11355/g.21618  ORF Transcript_11355/g.21618 Transcript_11355/m.21618 type:complete len:689 (-) Transcript_11355:83-2149(-)|eukprot:CAMPEP_0175124136 /NCGR_PEP_ID=MMETSP0087-20121206/2617_1 /TAXON_ID=136419 /ORGANISM="Unknown Unknown, Strain D1" /LENGTH=688 /DNA_ID=CAMNT_0016405877 /DNA_START=48 /DNA_END=2114 /DNA_ORIENTATION=-
MSEPEKRSSDDLSERRLSYAAHKRMSVLGISRASEKRSSIKNGTSLESPALIDVADNKECSVSYEKPPIADRKERIGWYMYDWANGAFFYGVLNILPILVLHQAGQSARTAYCDTHMPAGGNMTECMSGLLGNGTLGWAVSWYTVGECTDIGLLRVHTETNSSCLQAGGSWKPKAKEEATSVPLFGLDTDIASVWSTGITISVVIQLLVFVTLSSMADYGWIRKKMLIGNTAIASLACVAIAFATDVTLYWFNTLMVVVANVTMGFAVVFYNSYLPLLVAAHPDIDELASDALTTDSQILDRVKQLTNGLSSYGLAVGFAGQFTFLVLMLLLLLLLQDTLGYDTINYVVLLAGVWGLGFTLLFVGKWVKPRPGPPLPEGANYISVSFRQTASTLRTSKQLRQLFVFLGAYFIFSDGCSTIVGSAATFAANELQMGSSAILLAIVLVCVTGMAGSLLALKLERKCKIRPKTMLIVSLLVIGLCPLYGYVGLYSKNEFYVLAFVFGLAYGPQQVYTRALFASGVPRGREAEYFGFYEVTDKGTAWLGPLVVTLVNNQTGSYRAAFGSLTAFIVVGVAVLFCFNPEVADAERRKFEQDEGRSLASSKLSVTGRWGTQATISTNDLDITPGSQEVLLDDLSAANAIDAAAAASHISATLELGSEATHLNLALQGTEEGEGARGGEEETPVQV